MTLVNDELMNNYIDGDLNMMNFNELEEILKNSPKVLSQLNALKHAERTLRYLPIIETKSNFTSLVMKRIHNSIRSRQEQKKFILTVFSVFLFLCLTITGIIGFEVIRNLNSGTSKLVKDSANYIVHASELVSKLLSSQNISLVGGILSFGLIIIAWFFFDYNKLLRKVQK
jgi:hypothetical protein